MFKKTSKEKNNTKYKKIENIVLSIVLFFALILLLIRFFMPLCLTTKYKGENFLFTSVKELEGEELQRFIQCSDKILEIAKENPFYKPNKKVVFCFYDNKKLYSRIALGKSIGFVMNFGNYAVIHFSETDFINETITGMAEKYNQRTLVETAVHELTHVYLTKGLQALDAFLFPTWKREGVAEVIATSGSYDINQGLENFYAEIDDKSKQYDYFLYRLAVLYLMNEKDLSLEEIYVSKDYKFNQLLQEIRLYEKDYVLSWF